MKTLTITTMNTIKKAFVNTFINGTATGQEQAIVFVIIALPIIAAILIFGHIPKY